MSQIDFSAINSLSEENLYIFSNRLIDLCCDLNNCDQDGCKQFATDLDVRKLFSNQSSFNEQNMVQLCSYLIQNIYQLSTNLNDSILNETVLSEKVMQTLNECIDVRRKEIFKSFLFKMIAYKHFYLENYDWKVSVVLCNDKLSSIKVPILKLTLLLHEPHGGDVCKANANGNDNENSDNQTQLYEETVLSLSDSNSFNTFPNTNKPIRTVSLELTKEELASFIQKLEEAKKSLYEAMSV